MTFRPNQAGKTLVFKGQRIVKPRLPKVLGVRRSRKKR